MSPWKIAGAKLGAYIAPSFANTSLHAALASTTSRGVDADNASFGVGDLFMQPVWLGWTLKHWDVALGYGFYAPVGKYDTETVTVDVPLVGPRSFTAESLDNIGLGFWTHQFQGAVAWYPWTNKATAVTAGLTYEINGNKKDFDLTPGQNLTLTWGLSQYLPLTRDQNLLLEVGLAGYDTWQITDDSGSAARNPGVHDQVHGVGGQLGLTYVPGNVALNFHGFYEFAATDRFQGAAFGINLVQKF